MSVEQFPIGELAERANVTRRTIHYYMARGLLPPPEGAGVATTYSEEHLYRILLIKKLQEAYLPLDEIKKRVTIMSLDEVKKALDENMGPIMLQEERSEELLKLQVGVLYRRIPVGFDVEIHFPSGNHKAEELAKKLYEYAENIMKEG